jgi:hypothetical protein
MELEEMKILWDEMSTEVDKQKTLTDKLILQMTQERFNNRIQSISIPETFGSIFCFAIAFYILVNFNKLDTWYFLASGIYSVAYFLGIPILVLMSIKKMKKVNFGNNNFKQTLLDFAKAKNQFFFVQKISLYLSAGLIVTSLILAGKILSDKDIFMENGTVWFWYMPLMVTFLFFFSSWGLKHYRNKAKQAENLLKDLENEENN